MGSGRGDPSSARAHHLTAGALYDRARQPFWAARARLQAARAAGAGAPATADDRRLLDQAAATFERLGAVRALTRARAAQSATDPWPPLLPRPREVRPVEELLIGTSSRLDAATAG